MCPANIAKFLGFAGQNETPANIMNLPNGFAHHIYLYIAMKSPERERTWLPAQAKGNFKELWKPRKLVWRRFGIKTSLH